jgi:beta-N-acetylhexosaminidase
MARRGAYILGLAGPALTADEAAFFRDANPFGFILFARNVTTAPALSALTADLRSAVGWQAPILIDQEGGRVQRLRPPLARDWMPPLDFAKAAGPAAPRAFYLRARMIAHELMSYGIDVNCWPTADIARPETHPFLRNRCFGTDAATVTDCARAVCIGHLAGGVLPVMKHVPGHGLGRLDSHKELPVATASPDRLAAEDFAPFRALADLPLAMTAHLVYPAFDDRPATVSKRMIRLIRDEIGFSGLLMTDDLSMQALGGSIGGRTKAAISAGCDVALHCNGDMDEMKDVVSSAGWMSKAASKRAEAALSLRQPPQPIDIPALDAELEALLAGTGG